eukprot:243273-Pelagomonas_calceolata.AAC.2
MVNDLSESSVMSMSRNLPTPASACTPVSAEQVDQSTLKGSQPDGAAVPENGKGGASVSKAQLTKGDEAPFSPLSKALRSAP